MSDGYRTGNGNSPGGPALDAPGRAAPAVTTQGQGILRAEIVSTFNQSMDQLAPYMDLFGSQQRLISLVGLIAYKNPDLQKADPMSIVTSVIQAGAIGLDVNSVKGEAWLIPRYDRKAGRILCSFQPGYRGLVKLMKLSGEVKAAQCRLVYEGEPFKIRYTPDLEFVHEPDLDAPGDPYKVRYAYCYVRLASGEPIVEVMNGKQIEASRARGQSSSGPWSTDWEAMAKRCPVVPMSKWITLDNKLAAAFQAMYESDEGDPEPAPSTSVSMAGSAGLQAKLDAARRAKGHSEPPGPAPATAPVANQETPAAPEPAHDEPPFEPGHHEPQRAMPDDDPDPDVDIPLVSFEAWAESTVQIWNQWWITEAEKAAVALPSDKRWLCTYYTLVNGVCTDAIVKEWIDERSTLIPSKDHPETLVRGQAAATKAVKELYQDKPSDVEGLVRSHLLAKADRLIAEIRKAPAAATKA